MEPEVLTQPTADIAYIAMFDGTCEGEAETIITIISFRLTSTTDPEMRFWQRVANAGLTPVTVPGRPPLLKSRSVG